MASPADIDGEIDKQTLEEMTRFTTSPDIKNILVTGGNGFLYAPYWNLYHLALLIICCVLCAWDVPRTDQDSIEVLGSFEPSQLPIPIIIISSLSTSSSTALP